MNRRIIQLALVGAVSLVASAQASANVAYKGGRVLPTVRIIPIPYGAGASVPNAFLTDLVDFIRGAKNPSGKQTLYAQYGVTDAQKLPVTSVPADNNPRVLDDTEIKNIIHSVQQLNGISYGPDKVFVLLPGPGYSTVFGNCGYRSREGDGMYFAVVPRDCSTYLTTTSSHVLELATNPNGDGWAGSGGAGVVFPCLGHTWNFGNGDIALPWDNLTGACPPFSTNPNTPFDNKMIPVLQVVASRASDGALFHTVRHPGSWSTFGDVKVAAGSDPGKFFGVDSAATLGVFNHVVAATGTGVLYHTIRTETAWTPFVNVNTAAGAGSAVFSKVAVANVNGDLHVCGRINDGNGTILHTIRYQNGTWDTFGNVLGQTGVPPSGIPNDVACAGVGSEMHIAITTSTGGLYHAIRTPGGWSGWGDVEIAASEIGFAATVAGTSFGGELNLVATNSNRVQSHTIRHPSSWIPFVTPGPAANPLVFDQACAAMPEELHLVSIDNTFVIRHRIRPVAPPWGTVGDVTAAAGFQGNAFAVGATIGLGY